MSIADPERAAAYLWNALRCLSHDECDDRLLVPGRASVAAAIDACVSNRPVMAIVAGDLVIDRCQTDGPCGPDLDHVLALTLDQLSFTRRAALQDDLLRHVSAHRCLPPVSPQSLATARLLIDRLRSAGGQARDAMIRFERKVVR